MRTARWSQNPRNSCSSTTRDAQAVVFVHGCEVESVDDALAQAVEVVHAKESDAPRMLPFVFFWPARRYANLTEFEHKTLLQLFSDFLTQVRKLVQKEEEEEEDRVKIQLVTMGNAAHIAVHFMKHPHPNVYRHIMVRADFSSSEMFYDLHHRITLSKHVYLFFDTEDAYLKELERQDLVARVGRTGVTCRYDDEDMLHVVDATHATQDAIHLAIARACRGQRPQLRAESPTSDDLFYWDPSRKYYKLVHDAQGPVTTTTTAPQQQRQDNNNDVVEFTFHDIMLVAKYDISIRSALDHLDWGDTTCDPDAITARFNAVTKHNAVFEQGARKALQAAHIFSDGGSSSHLLHRLSQRTLVPDRAGDETKPAKIPPLIICSCCGGPDIIRCEREVRILYGSCRDQTVCDVNYLPDFAPLEWGTVKVGIMEGFVYLKQQGLTETYGMNRTWNDFIATVQEGIKKGVCQGFILVHGFDTPMQDAVIATAQVWANLANYSNEIVMPFLFTYPSSASSAWDGLATTASRRYEEFQKAVIELLKKSSSSCKKVCRREWRKCVWSSVLHCLQEFVLHVVTMGSGCHVVVNNDNKDINGKIIMVAPDIDQDKLDHFHHHHNDQVHIIFSDKDQTFELSNRSWPFTSRRVSRHGPLESTRFKNVHNMSDADQICFFNFRQSTKVFRGVRHLIKPPPNLIRYVECIAEKDNEGGQQLDVGEMEIARWSRNPNQPPPLLNSEVHVLVFVHGCEICTVKDALDQAIQVAQRNTARDRRVVPFVFSWPAQEYAHFTASEQEQIAQLFIDFLQQVKTVAQEEENTYSPSREVKMSLMLIGNAHDLASSSYLDTLSLCDTDLFLQQQNGAK